MKIKIITLLALSSLCFAAIAEQTAEWKFDEKGTTITDDEWTLQVRRRETKAVGPADTYELYIVGCNGTPSTPSTLNLAKPIPEYGGIKYAFTDTQSWGGWFSADQKAMIGRLLLPTNAEFKLTVGFPNCTNLTEITPLLPSNCISVVDKCFEGCTKLASPVVLHAATQIDGSQYIFHNTAIPSADLTDSTVTNLSRAMFAECPSLKSVKLPATLTQINDTIGPFAGCPALERVEFHSFPTGLNNGFRHTYSSWTLDANLTEIHFYDCAPTASPTATVFKDVANGKTLTTYLHDMSDEQLQAWGECCAEGGAITTTSTWKQGLVGKTIYTTRPLVEYSEKHAQIAAGVNAVVLDGQNGTIIVSRGDNDPCVGEQVVNYSVDGDAEAGTHYSALSGSVTISNGQSSATISVSGLYTGSAFEKGLTLTLTSGDYKIIEGKGSASISIISGYRSVSVTKIKDSNKQLGQVGSFRVSRGDGDSTVGDLSVSLVYSGTAGNGTTYRELPASVTIPAGKAYADFEIFPLDDASVTADSEAIISIGSGLYTPTGDSATVTIVYGNGVWGCWRIFDDGGTKKITDGTWTFNCSLKTVKVSTEDAYRLEVNAATTWPETVSSLNFNKGFVNVYGGVTYKIAFWNMNFGTVTTNVPSPTAAGEVLGDLTLSDGAHEATINNYAFAGCTNMVFDLANIPTNITLIGQWAFAGSYVSGTLSDPNLTTINDSAFRNCTGVTSLVSPRITKISDYAFYGATGLKLVDLGLNEDCALTTIGQYAFYGCTSLESFSPFLPSSLDKLDAREVFENCSSLTNALVFTGSNLGETKGWASCYLFKGCVKIPSADFSRSTITALRRAVFSDCTALKWIKLPSTFVEFGIPGAEGTVALCNRSPFDQQTLGPTSVKLYISSTNLPSFDIKIPEVTSIEFSTNLTTIADGAFASTGYSGLTELKFTGAKPATIGENLFTGQKANAITAYVPSKYVDSWKTVADDQIITRTSGTWTSDTTQNIRAYGSVKAGIKLILR